MLGLISEVKASEIVGRYFDDLYSVGYVRKGIADKVLAYLFLMDFIDSTHAFISEEDYGKIEEMMSVLFAGGSCLVPYPVFCTDHATLGTTDYEGDFILRKTEVGDYNRITEDENYRTA